MNTSFIELFGKNNELNEEAINEWVEFMFLNEPIAAYYRKYCQYADIPDSIMFKLIALTLMKQKQDHISKTILDAQYKGLPDVITIKEIDGKKYQFKVSSEVVQAVDVKEVDPIIDEEQLKTSYIPMFNDCGF